MKTSPVRISAALRYVAESIENSEAPSKQMVASDLQLIVAALEGAGPDDVKVADDGDQHLANLLWRSEEGKDVEEAYGVARKTPVEEKLIPALNGLKSSIDDFITVLKRSTGQGGGKTTRETIREEEESGDVMTSAPPMGRR
jgi:hypothetical protein